MKKEITEKDNIISFTEKGYLRINSKKIRSTDRYKNQLKEAEFLAKKLKLTNTFN